MARNKARLELALYARPKYPGTCHYALFVSSKFTKIDDRAREVQKHHVKNTLQNIDGEVSQPWRYECVEIPDVRVELRLLARIVVAKILDVHALREIFESVSIYQVDDVDQETAKNFNCVSWVRAALELAKEKGHITGFKDWDSCNSQARDYVERKATAGRWNVGAEGGSEIPTFDSLSGTELVE